MEISSNFTNQYSYHESKTENSSSSSTQSFSSYINTNATPEVSEIAEVTEEKEKTEFEKGLLYAGIIVHLPEGMTFEKLVALPQDEMTETMHDYKISFVPNEEMIKQVYDYSNDQVFNNALYNSSQKWLDDFDNKEENNNAIFLYSLRQATDISGLSSNGSQTKTIDPNDPTSGLVPIYRDPINFNNSSEVFDFIDTFLEYYEEQLEIGKETQKTGGETRNYYFQILNAKENIEFFNDVKYEYKKGLREAEDIKDLEIKKIEENRNRDADLSRKYISSL